MPTVSPITNINYTLSLSSDPLAGPYNTTVITALGNQLSIRLIQQTIGPISTASISFGDGSPLQNYTLNGYSYYYYTFHYVTMTYYYTAVGTYTVVATPIPLSFNGTTTVNTMTIIVAGPILYSCKKTTRCKMLYRVSFEFRILFMYTLVKINPLLTPFKSVILFANSGPLTTSRALSPFFLIIF
jgi:hypothetical protein